MARPVKKVLKVAAASLLINGCSHQPAAGPPIVPPPVVQPVGPKVATPGLLPPAPKLRLATSARPTNYLVEMRMSPKEEGIKGRVTVDVVLTEPTTAIFLHAGDNLGVTSATLGGQTARVERVNDEMVGLSFGAPLATGRGQLVLAYEGKLPSRDGRGAYRQEEKGDWYIFTQFESTDARRAFPCFDEPSFKTPYTISLNVPDDQLAFANTPEAGTKKGTDGWKTVTFAPSQPLPSYLVAFAVGPFEIVDGGKAGKKQTPIRIIVPKGRSADAKYAAQTTGSVLAKIEEYTDIPYPYEKLDHIAVPQKGGAMENPGLITYGNPTMLSNGDARSVRLERGYISIAAHELGHIWFGDYVTTAWWDDIWLNEAFATWMSSKIVEALHPEWDTAVQRATAKSNVMANDSLASARRIRQPIESRHDILNAFDDITYRKGAAVIEMMEHWVGTDQWKKAIHGYLQKHAYGNSTSQEFLSDMAGQLDAEHAGPFTNTFSSFLDQPGYPMIDAKLTCGKDEAPSLALTQYRFVPTGSLVAAEEWSIPFCAEFPGGQSCTLLRDHTAKLPLATKTCPDWVNPNAHASGYYRSYIDDKDETKLLQNKKAPSSERAAILGDELALLHTSKLTDDKVLGQVPMIMADGDRFLVAMTANYVGGLDSNLVSDAQMPKFAKFVRAQFLPKAKSLGWTAKDRPGQPEDDGTKLLRPQVIGLAADYDDAGLGAEARKLTVAWLADHKAIERDMLVSTLVGGMRGGDKAHWDKLHEAAKKTNDRQDRGALLEAMSRAKDPKIVEENLKLALTDEFDRREGITLVVGSASEPKNRQMVWDFVKKNYDALVAPLPWRSASAVVRVAAHFCDAEHKKDAADFFSDKASKWPGGPRIIAQTLEDMSLCIAERPAREKNIATFLGKY
jgi:alanyl aminopeptidase